MEIQPFIVTLAGMFLPRGLTTVLSINPVKVPHEGFNRLVQTKIEFPFLGYVAPKTGKLIPARLGIGAVVAVCVVVLIYLLLRYVRFGRNVYAMGGNPQSALMLGVNVKRTKFNTYLIRGLLRQYRTIRRRHLRRISRDLLPANISSRAKFIRICTTSFARYCPIE